MSKQRALLREQREAEQAQRQAAAQVRAEAQAGRRERQARRRRWWRSIRWWQRGNTSTRVRERRAVIASALLVVAIITYLVSGSIGITIGVLLVAALATPALVAALKDRG